MTLKLHPKAPLSQPCERLAYAKQIVRAEAAALEHVADRLDDTFLQAVELIRHCPGRVAVTGTGKSADVGQKIAGTLNSTGTRAYVLDATRAVHGDLGMVHPNDIVLALSHSGESEEIVRLLRSASAVGDGDRWLDQQWRTARWPGKPTSPSFSARWKKSARWAWRPAPAPRP